MGAELNGSIGTASDVDTDQTDTDQTDTDQTDSEQTAAPHGDSNPADLGGGASPASGDGATAAVAALLARGGAPEALVPEVLRQLGADAAAELESDPWLLLGVGGVRPEQADAFARTVLGSQARPDDPRRAAAVTVWLLERAAADGHTILPWPLVERALDGYGLSGGDLAGVLDDGRVLPLRVPTPRAGGDDVDAADTASDDGGVDGDADEESEAARGRDGAGAGAGRGVVGRDVVLALDRLAMAEESLAEGVARLTATAEPWGLPGTLQEVGVLRSVSAGLARSGVVVVAGAAGAGLETTVDALVTALGAAGVPTLHLPAAEVAGEWSAETGVVVVSGAERLGVEQAASLVERIGDGARLVLAGDPALLPSGGPGAVLADLAASGHVPAVRAQTVVDEPLGRLLAGLRGGTLPAVKAPDHQVVVVPVREPAELVHRVEQVVTASIPRAFGVTPDEIAVLTPLRGGSCGARALAERLAAGRGGQGCTVTTVHQARGRRWPAVVVVLPGEAGGYLDRAVVLTAVSRATRHVSVVYEAGLPLAAAVAQPGRPRRTRLALAVREAVAELTG